MATHSSILAWKISIHGVAEESDTTWVTKQQILKVTNIKLSIFGYPLSFFKDSGRAQTTLGKRIKFSQTSPMQRNLSRPQEPQSPPSRPELHLSTLDHCKHQALAFCPKSIWLKHIFTSLSPEPSSLHSHPTQNNSELP